MVRQVVSDEAVGGEIAVTMGQQIAAKVGVIRAAKSEIEALKESSGIAENERIIEEVRAELVKLTREFNDLTGINWQDEEGYARFVHKGESHRYPVDTVDEVAAALISLENEIDKETPDLPLRYTLKMEEETILAAFGDLESISAIGKAEVLEALSQEREARIKMAQEVQLRLNAMREMLTKLVASRITSETGETVQVR